MFSRDQAYVDGLKGQQVDQPVSVELGEVGRIHIAIDLESVREAEGVTERPEDLSDLYEASAIANFLLMAAKTLGRERLASISLTDYNPIINDQTGRLIAEFFYRVCLGLSMHQ